MRWAFILLLTLSCSHHPQHWWKPVPKDDLQWWEISPHEVKHCCVVLSKRNELGILSNFSYAPFKFEGKTYPSVEALWQSMKYPEKKSDVRYGKAKWPHTRAQVEKMESGPKAKEAGNFATKVMKQMNINWVTYKGRRIDYRVQEKGEHYRIIKAAMMAKLNQNTRVRDVLLSTGKLKLKPDHQTKKSDPPAWKYYQIWMEIRSELRK